MAPPASWSAMMLEQFGGFATFSLLRRTETAAPAAGHCALDDEKRATIAAATATGSAAMPGAATATPTIKEASALQRTSSGSASGRCMPPLEALLATCSSSSGADPDSSDGAEVLTPRRLLKQLSNASSSCGSDDVFVNVQRLLRESGYKNERLQRDLARANQENCILIKQNHGLKATVASLEAEVCRLEQATAYGNGTAGGDSAAIIAKLTTLTAGLQHERARLIDQVATLRGETDTLEQDKDDLQCRLALATAATAQALADGEARRQRQRREMARDVAQYEEEIDQLLGNAAELERQLAAASASRADDMVFAARGRMMEALSRQTCGERGDTYIDDLLDNVENFKAANGFEVLQQPRGMAGKNVQKVPDMDLEGRAASPASVSTSPLAPRQRVFWAVKRFQFHSDESIAQGGIDQPVPMDTVWMEKLVLESIKGWPAEVQQRIICEQQWTIRRNSQAATDPEGRDLELVIMFPFNPTGDMAQHFEQIVLDHAADVTAGRMSRYDALRAAFRTAMRFVAEMNRALAHLHRRGCIFNDVKPHNTSMAPDGFAALLDTESIEEMFEEVLGEPAVLATCLGTPGFIAPERQQRSQLPDGMIQFWSSVKSDIYGADKSLDWLLTVIEKYLGAQGLQELRHMSGLVQLQARCSAPFSERMGDADAVADALYDILAAEARRLW